MLAQKMDLELADKYEVRALHRIFFEAKYNSGPEDFDVQSSPFSSSIYERVFDLLIETSDDGEAAKWRSWRSLDQHLHRIPNLRKRIDMIHSSNWPDTEAGRRDFVLALCSPLIPNESQIADLIAAGNRAHNEC